METLVDLLRIASEKHPERTALSARSGLREDSWSYVRLWRSANALAHCFRNGLELEPGERLVVWGPNCPQLVACYFGAMLARLILVPVDPFSTAGFVERVIERTRAAALITGYPNQGVSARQVLNLANLPFNEETPPFPESPVASEIAEIVFTSGTTGTPKGVILTHRNIVANVESASRLLPANPDYRLLSILPLSHMLEQTVGLYIPLLFGAAVHYPASRQPPLLRKAMRRHRITTMIVVPQVLELMLRGIEREVERQGKSREWRRAHRMADHLPRRLRRLLFRDVHASLGEHLDFVICGGARLVPELAEAWERIGIKVIHGYGATECSPIIATNSYCKQVPGSVGPSAPGVQVRLSDDHEILVKGANVTSGYWENEVATSAAFNEQGWYRTGDLAEQDDQGCLYLQGRLRDLIVLPSGLKVHPEDVEHELRLEDTIADCVVLPLPDAAGNVQVHAAIIPTDTEIDDSINRAVRAANARLAPFQHVSGFTVWTHGDFPRTNIGKVKRHEVLASLATGAVLHAIHPVAIPGRDARFSRLTSALASVSDVSADAITPESDLTFDLHLDSLNRVELAMLLEEELGVVIEDSDLAAIETVAELQEFVEQGRPGSPPVDYPAWALTHRARLTRSLIQRLLIFPLHRLVCRPFRIEGLEHLRGLRLPVLLIANHSSHLDTPSILRALPPPLRRRTAVAAAADYFYRSRAIGSIASLVLNTFPFSREGAIRPSLEYCGELVDNGWSILLYPEGTRSTTGELQAFRSGIGLLATELDIPIVPLGIRGTYDALPKGRLLPRSATVTVRTGMPIFPSDLGAGDDSLARLERAVSQLLDETPEHPNGTASTEDN